LSRPASPRRARKPRKAVAFDARAWATGRKHAASRTCGTCANKPAARAIRDVLGIMASREGRPAMSELHGELVARCNYQMSLSAMMLHVRTCERGMWNAARNG